MGWPKIINFEFTLHLAHIINFLVPTNCPLETRSRTRLRSFKRDWCLDKFFRCWLGRMLTCLPVYFMSSFSFGCLTTSTWLVVHLTPLFFWGRLCRHLNAQTKLSAPFNIFFRHMSAWPVVLTIVYTNLLWVKNIIKYFILFFCGEQKFTNPFYVLDFLVATGLFFFFLFWSPFVGGASLFFLFFFVC